VTARPPVLQGRRVRLEPLEESHLESLWAAQDPTVWAYMPTRIGTRMELAAWVRDRRAGLASGTAIPFAQLDARSGAVVGSTSLFDIDRARGSAEIGHTWISRPHRRTALNTESKLLLLGHAFDAMRLTRVQLKCDERNAASRRAIERIGGVYEGTLRWTMPLADGTMRNTAVYSVIAPEWSAVKARLAGFLARN